jgi:hypothetical protein
MLDNQIDLLKMLNDLVKLLTGIGSLVAMMISWFKKNKKKQ